MNEQQQILVLKAEIYDINKQLIEASSILQRVASELGADSVEALFEKIKKLNERPEIVE
jgi:uncharacterized membrane protein affecting hemolysin expression